MLVDAEEGEGEELLMSRSMPEAARSSSYAIAGSHANLFETSVPHLIPGVSSDH